MGCQDMYILRKALEEAMFEDLFGLVANSFYSQIVQRSPISYKVLSSLYVAMCKHHKQSSVALPDIPYNHLLLYERLHGHFAISVT
jgi:hypothetical protein